MRHHACHAIPSVAPKVVTDPCGSSGVQLPVSPATGRTGDHLSGSWKSIAQEQNGLTNVADVSRPRPSIRHSPPHGKYQEHDAHWSGPRRRSRASRREVRRPALRYGDARHAHEQAAGTAPGRSCSAPSASTPSRARAVKAACASSRSCAFRTRCAGSSRPAAVMPRRTLPSRPTASPRGDRGRSSPPRRSWGRRSRARCAGASRSAPADPAPDP